MASGNHCFRSCSSYRSECQDMAGLSMLRCWYLEKVMMFWHFELATSLCCSICGSIHTTTSFPSTRSICLWSVGLWHSPSHAPGRRSFCQNSPSCRVHTIRITCRLDPSRQKYNPRGHCRSFRTCNRKKLQHDVNTVIWPCRLQWRFNYINHTDEKTTEKRNNMTDMTTICHYVRSWCKHLFVSTREPLQSFPPHPLSCQIHIS